jgi:hypothetical protein
MRPGKSLEKGASRVTPRGSVANGHFSSSKSIACKAPFAPDLGAFVQAQIASQRDELNAMDFSLPDGTKGRVWLASAKDGSKITGDDCLWRVNIEGLRRQEQHKRPVIQWRPTAEALRRPIIFVGRNGTTTDIAWQHATLTPAESVTKLRVIETLGPAQSG